MLYSVSFDNNEMDTLVNETEVSILIMLFNIMLIHDIAPDTLLLGTMTPIIKNNRESPNNSSNYRTLTIVTSLSKLFDLVIINNQNSIFDTFKLKFGF